MKTKRNHLLCSVLALLAILWHTVNAQVEPFDRRPLKQALPKRISSVWQYANQAVYPAGRYIIAPDNEGRLAFDPVLAGNLQRAIDSLRGVQNAPGVSAAFLIPGQGLWQGVSGISSASPIDSIRPDMLFSIGSNTKAFTSAMILTLADEGKLALDDSLGKWLPPYPNIDGSVKLRQLMNMTSGLFDFLNDAAVDSMFANPTGFWTPEEILTTFVGPPNGPPGSPWRYSNTNYILLGMVIKKITDSSYSSQLRRRILTPLALDRTYFDIEESYPGPLAHPWDLGNDIFPMPRTAMYSMAWSAGAIVSTAENLALWSKALYEGALISEASLNEMMTCGPLDPAGMLPGLTETGYGLGVMDGNLFGKRVLHHGGEIWGYRSDVGYFPQAKASLVVLLNATRNPLNTTEPNPYQFMAALLHTYLRTIPASLAEPGVLYALSGAQDSACVYTTDTSHAGLSRVGPYRYGEIVRARVHPKTGKFWGLARALGWELVQIDGVSGEAYPRVALRVSPMPPNVIKGMDFSSHGTLYLGALTYDRIPVIYTVDTASGVCTQALSAKVPISGLAFNPLTGDLWLAEQSSSTLGDRIYKVNLQTGDTLGVGNTGFSQPLTDIAFDARGNLYGIEGTGAGAPTNRLARIDTATGKGTEIGSLGLAGMQAIAFSPDAIASGVPYVLAGLPEAFKLEQNYPNPFNPSTTIKFELPKASMVRLSVYDMLGREVSVLVNERKNAGNHEVRFDASGLSSGVYFYRIQAGTYVETRKLLLLR
jgi:D-alanyl-D-alanine carboxypeptidase